jgi:hypothetical protein
MQTAADAVRANNNCKADSMGRQTTIRRELVVESIVGEE